MSIHATLVGGRMGGVVANEQGKLKDKVVQMFWESKLNQGPCRVAAVKPLPDAHAFHQSSGREDNKVLSTNRTEALHGLSTVPSSVCLQNKTTKKTSCIQTDERFTCYSSLNVQPDRPPSSALCIDTESSSQQKKLWCVWVCVTVFTKIKLNIHSRWYRQQLLHVYKV